MNIAGIVCEYNPMHSGHILHMDKTRQYLGADTPIICVMSGNFVQRGDFAIYDKFTRARCAIESGADLVLELPLPWSIASSEQFASAAVRILDATGICTHLSFGSETGDASSLSDIAEKLISPQFDEEVRASLKSGISYAAARQKAIEGMMEKSAEIMKMPNNILGIEYIKALKKSGSGIEPVAIKRVDSEHDGIGSASYIREMIKNGEDISDYLPEHICSIIKDDEKKGKHAVFSDKADMAIMAKLRSMTDDDYAALPYGSEGLHMRLKNAAFSCGSVREVLDDTKTKRYPYARIRRMVMCAYLGITDEDMRRTIPYIRVLAMNTVGMRLLAEMKKKAALPVIIKPSKVKKTDEEAKYVFEIGARGSDLYSLMYDDMKLRSGDGEYKATPIVM